MSLKLKPLSISDAKKFVGHYHRHNQPPLGGLFAVGVECDGVLVGAAIVGRPIARILDDGMTCEVTRVTTNGTYNACSILYGAAIRAAKSLGYERIITYTLAEESGASLRASGWTKDAELKERKTWSTPSRPREQTDMFGNEKRAAGAKIRWIRKLVT